MAGLIVLSQAPPAPLPPLVERRLEQDFHVRVWHRTEGLPAERVTALARTHDGYLWIGTPAGLARFDGLRFLRFDKANSPALADNRIQYLAADPGARLWIATEDGSVVAWTAEGWIAPRLGSARPRPSFQMSSSEHGRVWMQSPGGWVRSSNRGSPAIGTDSAAWEEAAAPIASVADVLESEDGTTCWVGWDTVLWRDAEGRRLAEFPLPKGADPNLAAAAVARDRDGSFWFTHGEFNASTPFRLYRMTSSALELLDDQVIPNPPPAVLVADPRRGFWHPSGTARLAHTTREARTRYALSGGSASDRALALETTPDGSVWVGWEVGGLMQLKPKRSLAVLAADGLPHPNVQSVIPWEPGVLAVGTGGGVARVRSVGPASGPAAWVESLGLEGASVRALARDHRGRLWAGTSRGLFFRQDDRWVSQRLPRILMGALDADSLGSGKVRDLRMSRGGDLWVAAAQQLVVLPAAGSAPRLVAALPESTVSCLLEDREGHLWVGTDRSGISVLGPAACREALGLPETAGITTEHDRWLIQPSARITTANGLASDQVWQIHEDSEGRLWVAGDRGLQRFPAATARRLAAGGLPSAEREHRPFLFTTHHGLPDLAVNAFVEDRQRNLWLGTDGGVFRIAAEDFDRVAAGGTGRVIPEVFGEIDGLPSSETTGRISHPAACVDDQGQVWFGTIAGLASLNRGGADRTEVPPRVALEQVRVDGRILASTLPADPEGGFPLDVGAGSRSAPRADRPSRFIQSGGSPARLAPGRGRVLEFRFTGFDFADPGSLRFRYQLAGYEEGFQEAGARREAYYTNLSPGSYCFRVWAADRHGRWSTAPAEFSFQLTPFVWQTLWFRVGSLVLAGALVATVVAGRIRHIRRLESLRRRAEQAELRTRLSRDLHDGVGSGLARLALLAHVPPTDALPAELATRQLKELSAAVRELADTVREVSWNASPESLSLEALVSRIAHQSAEYLGAAGIRCHTSLPLGFPDLQLPPEQRSSLYFAAKEAVANLVRHSGATEARLTVEIPDGHLVLTLADNGRGLPDSLPREEPGSGAASPDRSRGGNGLPNLRARIVALGGVLRLESSPGQGTTLVFRIPLRHLGRPETGD
jgi:signal transduction histidine kinase/ligand-binding sensor domain-containing protein